LSPPEREPIRRVSQTPSAGKSRLPRRPLQGTPRNDEESEFRGQTQGRLYIMLLPSLRATEGSVAISRTVSGVKPKVLGQTARGCPSIAVGEKSALSYRGIMGTDTNGGRLIGLDVGERRIGVAVSDETHTIALPECVIVRETSDEDIRALCDLAREKHGERFVVGLPLRTDGSHGVEAESATAFANRLAERSGIPVEMSDERLSTKEMERHLIESGVRRDRRRKVIDKMAAQRILQTYIDARRSRAKDQSR